jgi:2-polyprenyl-3-methyl-5-hydroxy-6-metoxy-1,4-benzoquinol methylase
MTDRPVLVRRKCWCGDDQLEPFSVDYKQCVACGTLVSQVGLSAAELEVRDDTSAFYGKEYWLSHMTDNLGFADIRGRARQDIPERCLHWLRTLLTYKLPPARVLEIGCGHGGFVALMRWAGFDVTGLELSPWVADFARQTFDIPMLVGPIEEQDLPAQSLDAIVLNDVVEHLPDPVQTMRRCVELLRWNGILIIQMPERPEGKQHDQLVAEQNRFLEHTRIANEHLNLFSKRAALRLMANVGLIECQFESPMFDYDMYFVASRTPQPRNSDEKVAAHLLSTSSTRLIQVLLDKAAETNRIRRLWEEAEKDRAARLVIINQLGEQLKASEADRSDRLAVINELGEQLLASDADRADRLAVINRLGERLKASDADRAAHLEAIRNLGEQVRKRSSSLASRWFRRLSNPFRIRR